jgi:hypothetical protein
LGVTDHKKTKMKQILIITLSLITMKLSSQNDSLNFESFNKYYQINMGLSYANLNGKVSNFTKQGGSFDMLFADGRRNNIYGFNMNVLLSNKIEEFTIPAGYEHYDNPATVFFGVFYGRTFGNVHKSHFQGTFGINYGWLLHKKQNDDIGGYHGFVPQIEFSRSIRIGKSKYSDYQYTSEDNRLDSSYWDLQPINSPEWHKIVFNNTVTLIQGRTYTIRFWGSGFYSDVSYAVNNAYPGGSIKDPGFGADCSEINGLDLIFRLHISSGGNLEENAQWIPLN